MDKRKKMLVLMVLFGISVILEMWVLSSDSKQKDVEYVSTATRSAHSREIFLSKHSVGYRKGSHPDVRQQEVRHIAFLKVHKAASSTMLNILYRFGSSRKLTFVLPNIANYIWYSGRSTNVLPPAKNRTFDILCNQVIFSRDLFMNMMPKDTVHIAVVREPFKRLYSAFVYYLKEFPKEYLKHITRSKGRSKTNISKSFATYLKDPQIYEPINPNASHTNNRMAVDFGYPAEDFGNTAKFKEYLTVLDNYFDIVMVTELFDESVVLMRRLLHWKIKDILYVPQNTMKKPRPPSPSNDTLARVRSFLQLDYMLYEYFLHRLQQKIEHQGGDFNAEVTYFKHIQARLNTFCLGNTNGHMDIHDIISFSSSKWNEDFFVTRRECKLMTIYELKFVDKIRQSHINLLKKYGTNNEWISSSKYDLITNWRYSRKQHNVLHLRSRLPTLQ